DTPRSGQFGDALRSALRPRLEPEGIAVMMVECLGSCRRPGAVAFDAPDKARIRVSDLNSQDATALVRAALEYSRGKYDAGPAAFPPGLRQKVSAVAPKHGSRRSA